MILIRLSRLEAVTEDLLVACNELGSSFVYILSILPLKERSLFKIFCNVQIAILCPNPELVLLVDSCRADPP